MNPVLHFELPVRNMARAIRFYEALFAVKLDRKRVDGYDMAFFPESPTLPGASGALAKGDVYVPTRHGVILYFTVANLDTTLAAAKGLGAKLLYAKKEVAPQTWVAEVQDSEGNRLALIQRPR